MTCQPATIFAPRLAHTMPVRGFQMWRILQPLLHPAHQPERVSPRQRQAGISGRGPLDHSKERAESGFPQPDSCHATPYHASSSRNATPQRHTVLSIACTTHLHHMVSTRITHAPTAHCPCRLWTNLYHWSQIGSYQIAFSAQLCHSMDPVDGNFWMIGTVFLVRLRTGTWMEQSTA